MTKDSLDFEPVLLSPSFLIHWWILVLGMLIGGLLALVASYSLPPVYETSFKIVSDVRITAADEITEIMLDAAINHIGDMALNPVVIDRLLDALANQAIPLTKDELQEITSIERRLNSTYLKVRNTDPQVAKTIADTWGLVYYAMLQDAYKNALIADDLSEYQESLVVCLQEDDSSPCGKYCGLARIELEGEITRIGDLIAENRNESLGLYSELTVAQYEEADYPEKPAIYGQRSLILAGVVLGFLAGLLFIELWIPRRSASG